MGVTSKRGSTSKFAAVSPIRYGQAWVVDLYKSGMLCCCVMPASLQKYQVRTQPHCFFNGVFGTRASIVYGAASETFMSVEDERCRPHIFKPDEFSFVNGKYSVPDVPGLGLEIDPDIYRQKYACNAVSVKL